MYEFLVQYPVIAFIFIVLVVIAIIYLAIKFVQIIGLERIRGYVYKLFVEAEHEFEHGENIQKFEYVVQLARSHLPTWAEPFITEKLLRSVIQIWFDLCKDLLDDGKFNGTGKEG